MRPDGSGLEDLVMGSGNYGLRGLAIDWIAGELESGTTQHGGTRFIVNSKISQI